MDKFCFIIPEHWTTLKKLIWLKLSGAVDAVYKTVTGAIVSFTAKRSAPLRSLLVTLTPQQSGSGDPSPDNVRPITGYSALTVNRTGVNVAENSTIFNGAISSTTGIVNASNTRLVTTNFIPVKAGTYTILTTPELANIVRVYGAANVDSFIQDEGDGATWHANGRTITFVEDRYIRIMFSYNMGAQTEISTTDLQYLSVSETSTTIPITIPTKNLLCPAYIVSGGIKDNDGTIGTNSTRVTSGLIAVTAGETYTASIETGKKIVAFHGYNSSKVGVGSNVTGVTSYTIPSGVAYIRVAFGYDDDADISPSDVTKAQVEKGSATAYEPYIGGAYGGTIDVVSGLLTLNQAYTKPVTQAATAGAAGTYGYGKNYNLPFNVIPRSSSGQITEALTSMGFWERGYYYNTIARIESNVDYLNEHPNQFVFPSSGGGVLIYAKGTTAETFDTYIADLEICYPIVEQTFQLTPTEVQQLVGMNNIWSDADSVTVEYRSN